MIILVPAVLNDHSWPPLGSTTLISKRNQLPNARNRKKRFLRYFRDGPLCCQCGDTLSHCCLSILCHSVCSCRRTLQTRARNTRTRRLRLRHAWLLKSKRIRKMWRNLPRKFVRELWPSKVSRSKSRYVSCYRSSGCSALLLRGVRFLARSTGIGRRYSWLCFRLCCSASPWVSGA